MTAPWVIMLGNAVLATILAGLVCLLAKRVRHPPLIHALWVLVLVKLVTPPLVFWPVPLPAFAAPAMRAASLPETAVWRPGQPPEGPLPSIPSALEAAGSSDAGHAEVGHHAALRGFYVAVDHVACYWAWTVWLGGCLAYLGVCWRRRQRLQRWLRHARLAPTPWQHETEALARRLGLRRAPSVWQVDAAVPPMVVFGRGGPRIVMPTELVRRWDDRSRAAILLHELAHLRRGDHWVHRLELVVRAVYWWYPVVAWMGWQLHAAEEECCDLVAVESLSDGRRHYAQTLLDMVDFLGQSPPSIVRHPLAMSSYSTFSSLKRRLTMVLDELPRARLTWQWMLAVAVLSVLALPVGLCRADGEGRSTEGCDRASESGEVKEAVPRRRRHTPSPERPTEVLPPDGTRWEMYPSTSRVLVANKALPRVQVNNPDVLGLSALSATEIQIRARKPGAAEVTLWDEDGKTRTIHVTVSDAPTYVLHVTLVELDRQGRRKVLSEPSIVTAEGKACFFHVGGELPPLGFMEPMEPLEYGITFRARVYRSEDQTYLDATLRTTDAPKVDDTSVRLEGKELRILEQVTLGKKMTVPFQQIRDLGDGPRRVKMQVEVTVERVLPGVEEPTPRAALQPYDEPCRSWALLGLTLRRASPDAVLGRYRGGLEVLDVQPDSPAERGGLRPGDVLVGMGVWHTTSGKDVDYVLGRPEVGGGEPVKFYVRRGKETLYGHLAVPKQSSL